MGGTHKYKRINSINFNYHSKFKSHILPSLPKSYHSLEAENYELCIWRFISPGCHSCNGHSVKCGAYLSNEEIDRREKARSLEDSLIEKEISP